MRFALLQMINTNKSKIKKFHQYIDSLMLYGIKLAYHY